MSDLEDIKQRAIDRLRAIKIEKRALNDESKKLRAILATLGYQVNNSEATMYVATIELRPIIQLWIDQGSTLTSLADEALISHRTIKRLLSGETKFTDEFIADRIRQAVGVPHYELHFVPNPHKAPPTVYFEE